MNRRLLGMCWALVAASGCQKIAGLDEFESAQSVGGAGEGSSTSGGAFGNAGEGGAADGGTSGSTGGKSSGGSASTGGTDTGGTDTGGTSSGGANTGGSTTGGTNSGGTGTGGDNTGGASTGGASTGGSGTGGVSTGGASTGGSGTGGGAGACATDNGGCDENATCTDTGSGVSCQCKPAYLGDGASCMLRTERVGLAAFDPPPVAFTGSPSISRDGRFVAFSSTDATLVAGDTNAKSDIFVRNLLTGSVERVSVSNGEAEANGASRYPAISSDGRYIVFSSIATNLVSGDTNGFEDVFIRDRTAGTTLRVSVASNGTQGNAVAYMADVSDNGRYVAFASDASNLVTGDTNGSIDIFLRDVTSNTTTRESILSDETQASGDSTRPAISGDGTRIAFESLATMGLVDAGGATDIFVRDRTAGTTIRVSESSSGAHPSELSNAAAISGDGRYVAFYSLGTNLVTGDTEGNGDVFVHDLTSGETTRVSVSSAGVAGDGGSSAPSLSADGRYVAFGSMATNLVANDTNAQRDVFVFDRTTNTTVRVSVSGLGVEGDGASRYASISGDGSIIAFDSAATNLVSDDTNGLVDLFVRRR